MSTASSKAFEGRVALITGAGDADGLGFAHARFLAERGARIVLNDFGGGTLGLPVQGVDAGVAEAAAERIRALGGEAIANAGDVGDPRTAQDMVQSALDTWGRLDIVVNNAGIASAAFFPDVDEEEMQRHLRVTLLGCLHTARAAWPYFIEKGYGRIVNTGSPACFGNEIAAYSSTKAGLFGLTRTAAIFGAAHGIRVNQLLPAAWSRLTALLPDSDFKTRLHADFGSDRISPLVGWLVSDRCDVSGETFTAGGGGFSRVVYAAGGVQPAEGDLDEVGQAVGRAMDDTGWTVFRSTQDNMVHLGMPAEDEPSVTKSVDADEPGSGRG
ncbi:MAG: SDR family NAD(P)-dependent oxidoreductase [bacterium]|nr:SDR family NAD(P)-dependent oxidoreductase [bacterium]